MNLIDLSDNLHHLLNIFINEKRIIKKKHKIFKIFNYIEFKKNKN